MTGGSRGEACINLQQLQHVATLWQATACNMAKISISEAARLTGKNRSTLHRHIKTGKLSKDSDDEGNPVLDTSELARVYPSFKVPVAKQHPPVVLQSNSKQQAATPYETSYATVEIELLKLRLQNAEEKITIEESRRREAEQREREAKEEINRLLGIVEKHTYLLAASQAPEEVPSEQPRTGWWKRLFS